MWGFTSDTIVNDARSTHKSDNLRFEVTGNYGRGTCMNRGKEATCLLAPHHFWIRSKAKMVMEQCNVDHILKDPPITTALNSEERIAHLEQIVKSLNNNMERLLALLKA
ncbi:hypothetical protein CDL15_Pgr016536 [Punica granatum]|uniref:Uncharacterized protein n=1 Tax=Punica granatum TaxID=22663 RepID=A0A218WJ91_PUNGR|nr:hypothetical protein CDL15_Pgr016536 [Punica granatum]PKI49678.1 hypothetical protein CRG98_029923 [Punica granatum]